MKAGLPRLEMNQWMKWLNLRERKGPPVSNGNSQEDKVEKRINVEFKWTEKWNREQNCERLWTDRERKITFQGYDNNTSRQDRITTRCMELYLGEQKQYNNQMVEQPQKGLREG